MNSPVRLYLKKSMKEKTKELGNSNVLFDFYGKRPEMSQLVPLSLQHVLAAIVGVITPSMIIAGVCGLTDAEKTMMIPYSPPMKITYLIN